MDFFETVPAHDFINPIYPFKAVFLSLSCRSNVNRVTNKATKQE